MLEVTVDYKNYWGLRRAPFENTPDPKFYFPAEHHQESIQRLLFGIKENKGAVLLSGDIGCGKTLLSRELILHLPKERFDIALIANPTFDPTEFLREILFQLGLPARGSKVEVLQQLNKHLMKNHNKGINTVVIIDEAQAIQDERIYEEIRLLLNFQLNERFLLTLTIIGQPEIQDQISSIPQLAQRIAIRSHLATLNLQETIGYIQYRLKVGGCTREIFSQEALAWIYTESNGIPRRINTLCDLALLVGNMEQADSNFSADA